MLRRAHIVILCSAVGALASCAADEATEAEEHPSVVVTQWNDSTELFLEYPELVAGRQTGNWAIHLTDMTEFQPIRSGTLTVRVAPVDGPPRPFLPPTARRFWPSPEWLSISRANLLGASPESSTASRAGWCAATRPRPTPRRW